MARPEFQYCTTKDGVSIAYYTMGEGPPLVFTSTVLWSHLRIRLIPEYHRSGSGLGRFNRIVRYDARGTGLSDRNTLDYSLDARLEDLESVVDHLELQRFDLLGFGHGGPTAIAYTASHPDRVAHLVLGRTWVNGAERQQAPSMESLHTTMLDQNWEEYTLLMANINIVYADSDLALRLAAVYREAMTPEGVRAYWSAMEAIDVRPLLDRIRVPTLIVRASGPVPGTTAGSLADYTREITTKIPGARLVETRGDVEAGWLGVGGVQAAEEFLGVGESVRTAPAPALPSGTAVILFADIADSTALTERLGDAAFRAKARELGGSLRAVIRECGGTSVEGPTLGDGVLAAFGSAREAIEAARLCGKAGDDAGLPLHIGLHAGDVTREQDPDGRDNVYGGAVNIASRISGLSAPGEVLVSDIVRGLARTSGGVSFEDRGRRKLKGVGEAVRVWAVREAERKPSTGSGRTEG